MKAHNLAVLAALFAAASVQAQQPAPPAASAPVTLRELIAEAERVHPSLRAAEQTIQSKLARVPQARSLPDPMVSAGWMGNITPFQVQKGDPSSFRFLEAKEEIPYPGKLKLRGQIASQEAEAERWTLEALRRRLRAEVAAAYFELWSTDKAIEISEQNKSLLEKLARIAEEKYRVGQGLQQDVLRAQVEVSRILQRLTVLRQQRQTLVARLNTLQLRPPDAPLGSLAPVEKTDLFYSLDELLDRAVAANPEIRRQEELIEQNQYAVNLAQRDYYPDFEIRYLYQQRPVMPDMHGITFGISIPVFYKSKQREAVNEASASLAAARHQREVIRTELLYAVKQYYLAARASEELLALYRKGIVPQSTLALESALAAYQVGRLDFLSLITNFVTVLDYEIEYYSELAKYQTAIARLEEITAIELLQ